MVGGIIERLIYINNIKTFGGCYLCTGCGKVIAVGQEHWDDLDLPWHQECVPIIEKVDNFQEMDI